MTKVVGWSASWVTDSAQKKKGRARPAKEPLGIELALRSVVRSGKRTPGGWGAENYRSLRRTGPSEATIGSSLPTVASKGPNKGKIVELTGPGPSRAGLRTDRPHEFPPCLPAERCHHDDGMTRRRTHWRGRRQRAVRRPGGTIALAAVNQQRPASQRSPSTAGTEPDPAGLRAQGRRWRMA